MTKAIDRQTGGSHYKTRAIQPIQYIQANELGYCEGNVVKYVTRHKDKNGREDIEKAIHYLQFILEHEYAEDNPEKFSDPYADAIARNCRHTELDTANAT